MEWIALKVAATLLASYTVAAPASDARSAYWDLVRARAVADGGVLAGGDGLLAHVAPETKGFGEVGRGPDQVGYRVVTGRRPSLQLRTAGDERTLDVVARPALAARTVKVFWDDRVLGTVEFAGGWQVARFALTEADAKAGGHRLDLAIVKAGAALPAAEVPVPAEALLLLHSVHVLPGTPAEAAAFSGPRDEPDVLWLIGGERVRYLLPVPAGSRLAAETVRVRGASPPAGVTVSALGEDGQTFALGEIKPGAPAELDLAALPVDTVVQLDLVAAAGAGDIGLVTPRLTAPPPAAPKVTEPWQKPKNVILYVIDTLRGDRVSHINPDSPVKTPRLDAFAAEGTSMAGNMVQGNYSKSTGCSLFSSTYNDVHRCHSLDHQLPRNIEVVQEVFKKAGFATAGLIVNGYLTARWGYKRGWDAYHNYMSDRGRLGFDAYGKDLDWGRQKGVRAIRGECVTRDAAEWILSLGDKPFFLYIQTIDPHHPYRVPRPFWEPYVPFKLGRKLPLDPNATGVFADGYNAGTKRFTDQQWEFFKALYYGTVAYSDHYFGKFIDFLKAQGKLDETLIVVSADHGEGFLEHGTLGHGVLSLYDEVVRVIWITRYPGYVPAGRIVHTSVEAMDISPTLVGAAGLQAPAAWQGMSRLPLLRGPEPLVALPAFTTMSDQMVAMRLGRYKYVRFRNKTHLREVFDLATDPGEKTNLTRTRPFVERYLETYVAWFERESKTWRRAERGALGDFAPQGPASGPREAAAAP